MSNHTPGPWHIGKDARTVYGPNGEQISDLRDDTVPELQSYANARLIAAAPSLLALCTQTRELCRQLTSLANLNDETRAMLSSLGELHNEALEKAGYNAEEE
jgi:hypothetical protein